MDAHERVFFCINVYNNDNNNNKIYLVHLGC